MSDYWNHMHWTIILLHRCTDYMMNYQKYFTLKYPDSDSCMHYITLVLVCCQVCCQQCGGPCQCQGSVPFCPEGVPLILDGCQCCQVCARQQGEACSEVFPCDSQRGLQCDYSASFPGDPGECVSECKLLQQPNDLKTFNTVKYCPPIALDWPFSHIIYNAGFLFATLFWTFCHHLERHFEHLIHHLWCRFEHFIHPSRWVHSVYHLMIIRPNPA